MRYFVFGNLHELDEKLYNVNKLIGITTLDIGILFIRLIEVSEVLQK